MDASLADESDSSLGANGLMRPRALGGDGQDELLMNLLKAAFVWASARSSAGHSNGFLIQA